MWTNLPAIKDIPGGLQLRTFQSSDLENGALEINHGKGTTIVYPVALFDPDGKQQPSAGLFSVVDERSGSVDFGGSGSEINSGKWLIILQYIYL